MSNVFPNKRTSKLIRKIIILIDEELMTCTNIVRNCDLQRKNKSLKTKLSAHPSFDLQLF